MTHNVKTLIVWFLMIPYNLILLFAPLAVMRFIFQMRGVDATVIGMFMGAIFFGVSGMSPKLGDKDG